MSQQKDFPLNPFLLREPLNQNDHLHHLGLSTSDFDFKQVFGDVKFIICGGSATRMLQFAKLFAKMLDIPSDKVRNFAEKTDRFVLYKAGPILCGNHGMGNASCSIFLHEIIKLCHHSGIRQQVTIMRVGTSGGIGVHPGTVVITDQAMSERLEPFLRAVVCGKEIIRPCETSQHVRRGLVDSWRQHLEKLSPLNGVSRETTLDADSNANSTPSTNGRVDATIEVIEANTVGTNDFYEAQARMDGAFCDHTEADQKAFLNSCVEKGVRNMEMEAPQFSSMLHKAGIDHAIICVTLVNRLESDKITTPHETLKLMDTFSLRVVMAYIAESLGKKFNFDSLKN